MKLDTEADSFLYKWGTGVSSDVAIPSKEMMAARFGCCMETHWHECALHLEKQ